MELKSLVCPHCGANTTNTQNCEYCGSLLVRFVDKGIDISDTSYLSGTCEYPGLLTELKNNLKLQEENPDESVITDILWKKEHLYASLSILKSGNCIWKDQSPINLGSKEGGLIIITDFSLHMDNEAYKDFNQEVDRLLSNFKQLKSFPLFTSHFCSFSDSYGRERYCREYAIDFGKDAEGAATLISEMLSEVEGLKPTDSYDIMTNVGDDAIGQARKAWYKAHGYDYVDEDSDHSSSGDDDLDHSSSGDDDLDRLFKILGILIFIGYLLYLFLG